MCVYCTTMTKQSGNCGEFFDTTIVGTNVEFILHPQMKVERKKKGRKNNNIILT